MSPGASGRPPGPGHLNPPLWGLQRRAPSPPGVGVGVAGPSRSHPSVPGPLWPPPGGHGGASCEPAFPRRPQWLPHHGTLRLPCPRRSGLSAGRHRGPGEAGEQQQQQPRAPPPASRPGTRCRSLSRRAAPGASHPAVSCARAGRGPGFGLPLKGGMGLVRFPGEASAPASAPTRVFPRCPSRCGLQDGQGPLREMGRGGGPRGASGGLGAQALRGAQRLWAL